MPRKDITVEAIELLGVDFTDLEIVINTYLADLRRNHDILEDLLYTIPTCGPEADEELINVEDEALDLIVAVENTALHLKELCDEIGQLVKDAEFAIHDKSIREFISLPNKVKMRRNQYLADEIRRLSLRSIAMRKEVKSHFINTRAIMTAVQELRRRAPTEQ